MSLEDFTASCIECALWSSTDNSDDSGGEPLDKNYDEGDLSDECRAEIEKDCKDFYESNIGLLVQYFELGDFSDDSAGHDFWLTRNGHGAGFWDRGLGTIGDRLAKECKPYGSADLYVGDDGKIHCA